MVVEYKEWYIKNDIKNISMPPRADLLTKLVPSAFFGFDKEGHPIYIERTGAIHCELLMNLFTDNEIYMAHVYGQERQISRCYESAERLGLPRGSIESFTTIMDLEGLSLSHRAALRFTQLITTADQKYYPERMHKTIIVNAPGLFSFFWRLVQGWLPAATREKIVVCSSDNRELFELVDRDQIPTRYGGTAEVPGLEDPDIKQLYELYAKDTRRPEEYTVQKMKSGTEYRMNIPMAPHETYSWIFKADDSLGFEAMFTPDASPDGTQDHVRVVTTYSKVPADTIPNQGVFTTERPGTLNLLWKNENWFSTLRLHYIVEKVQAEPPLSEEALAELTAIASTAPAVAADEAKTSTEGEADSSPALSTPEQDPTVIVENTPASPTAVPAADNSLAVQTNAVMPEPVTVE